MDISDYVCFATNVHTVNNIAVCTFFSHLLTVPPRWPTRVFAAESVRRVIQVCDGNTVHFDIEMAREMRTKTGGGKTDMPF